MAENIFANLIPRGSLGLKLLLVCLLVLAMGIPMLFVASLVHDRQTLAQQVTNDIGSHAGGAQNVGGPMLLVGYRRETEAPDAQGVMRQRTDHGYYLVFADTGSADVELTVEDRHRGIYRAATYTAKTDFHAHFRPAEALRDLDASYTLDWANARFVMYVSDSRAVRDVAELRFADGAIATLEPLSGLAIAKPASQAGYAETPVDPLNGMQAFSARAPFTTPPATFDVDTHLVVGGAQNFSIAAFAQDTHVKMHGNRGDASLVGYFQSASPPQLQPRHFAAEWNVPFVARGLDKVVDVASANLGALATRDMGVTFVTSDDIYNGVMRAVKYAIMFIGIVFLAVLIFEAVSGRKAHPAQYILVGLAQCIFYLLLLSLTELMGFAVAFALGAGATVVLVSYYAGASFKSSAIGVRAFLALGLLYGAMYVLMTLEDFAMLAGSLVAFAVIAATMIATRGIDWYGRRAAAVAGE